MILVIRKCAETRTYTGGGTYCALLSCSFETEESALAGSFALFEKKRWELLCKIWGTFLTKVRQ